MEDGEDLEATTQIKFNEELGASENAACVPAPHFFGAYRRSYSYVNDGSLRSFAKTWWEILYLGFEKTGFEVYSLLLDNWFRMW